MKFRLLICSAIISLIVPLSFSQQSTQKVYNVKDFGAIVDGKTDDAAAIQKAIDG